MTSGNAPPKRASLPIELRALDRDADFADAVRLQKTIWGFDDIELLPKRLFVVTATIGGLVLGAFDRGRMIGFCLAIPGIKPDGAPYLHSQMLGVLEEYRNLGAGRLLKLEQRNEALRQGIGLIEWTFDPLEIKNAYFNIERLGVVVRRFVLNQYGITTNRFQTGLPTDRCTAEWHLSSSRVTSILASTASEREEGEREKFRAAARILIPANIQAIKESDPSKAREIQKRVADQFLEHFSRNLAVTGFERTPEAGIYLLTPWGSS